ncbi:hypothetical protein RF11_06559 [Thelohanellus kitauei]|uniref:Uncharacterized protein n=1 Tax=Thelohanellus kitauei TaxID=669202 RepID=A0A0C2JEV0_THEKT|nr:hypothetical protein RF11_06559 [Thelohanellus kitauei]
MARISPFITTDELKDSSEMAIVFSCHQQRRFWCINPDAMEMFKMPWFLDSCAKNDEVALYTIAAFLSSGLFKPTRHCGEIMAITMNPELAGGQSLSRGMP